jgi:hypothetical protein
MKGNPYRQDHRDIVIVGANVELGFEAAKHFVSIDSKKLVLGCRSQARRRYTNSLLD